MEWNKEKGKYLEKDNMQAEDLFLFTVNNQHGIIDQFGGKYKAIK
ncbi:MULTISPECIES: hypothetical protein [unclassified Granulicatella]|nr:MULTISPECIES: hypothetical protein [unclassified Granulicatella]